jgi:hypothetical protein
MVQTPPSTKIVNPNVVFNKEGKELDLPGLCDIDEIMYLELILKAKVRYAPSRDNASHNHTMAPVFGTTA